MSNRYICRLNPFEEEYLETNNIEFSKFVHDNFYYNMKRDYHEYVKRLTIGVGLILFGMIFVSLTYLIAHPIVYLAVWVLAVFFIVVGFYTTGWEIKNGRKHK